MMRDTKKRWPVLYGCAAIVVALIVMGAALAPWIAVYDPTQVMTDEILQYPSWRHWLGTDGLGRDIWSRTVYGARVSVIFAATAAFCTMCVGLILGMIGGYFGGTADRVIQCLVNLVQGLPSMSLMIAIAAVLPENDGRLIIAVTVTSWAGFSRIVRGEVMRIKGEPYVEGITAVGAGHGYILQKYIFPNVLPVVIVLLTLRIGTSLLSASALSYLGLGVSPPTADWGVMISDARTYFRTYPIMMLAPGVGITLFCMSINLLGDALRDTMLLKNGGEGEGRHGY